MRHPRLLFPASLLTLALAACPNEPYDQPTTAGDTSTGGASTGEPEPTTTGTGEPVAPELPTNRFFMRIDDTPPPPVVAELNKEQALKIFGEQTAKEIKLLDVPADDLLKEVLQRIQSSCGDAWKSNAKDPQHNCALTELGKTYGANWRKSAQYRMVTLLTMTPANANVYGTSLSDLEQFFLQNPNLVKATFAQVLAGSMFCEGTPAEQKVCAGNPPTNLLTRNLLELSVLQAALKDTLLTSHPEINPDGTLPVTLYDALLDMQPLSTKFGPAGGHPGLLVPDDDTFTTYSDALTPAFKMVATAASNLRRVDGIDASVGAGEMFVSLAAAPLAFDFTDADKVKFEGIAPVPTVDMRMKISELDKRVPSCEEQPDCKTNAPGDSAGIEYVWSQERWSFEYIVAAAAREAFKDRVFNHCYFSLNNTCYIGVSIGGGGDPPGWTAFQEKFDDPNLKMPLPQFFWELLLDVAQTSVHDFECKDTPDYDQDGNTTEIMACAGPNDADPANDPDLEIEEGMMAPVFALKKVPLGLTAEVLIEKLRETMQTQADKIGDALAGSYWKNNARLDFYYRRGDDDNPYLWFVAPSDKRPAAGDPDQLDAAVYAKPGFFGDPALTQKVSSTDIPGVADTEHEKFALPTGVTTLYMQDDEAKTYELTFTVNDPLEIVVRVSPL